MCSLTTEICENSVSEKKWEIFPFFFHKHVEIKINTPKQSMNKPQGKQNHRKDRKYSEINKDKTYLNIWYELKQCIDRNTQLQNMC